mgnify:CR=1 FL=1
MIADTKLQEMIRWSPLVYWDEDKVFINKRHEPQIQILDCFNSGAEKIVIEAGTRFGKTEIASYLALKTFLEKLNDVKKGKRDSVKIWIVAPSYELTKKVFENIVKWFLTISPRSANEISYRPFPQIKIAEGVWIQGKSATEPESLLGEELDLLIIDEASRIKREIWESYLYARLTSRNGRVVMISTPFGQNWFHEEYLKTKLLGSGFNFRTIDNPYFSVEKWEEAKKMLPERVFKQEFEASALPDAASVFRKVREAISDICLSEPQSGHYYTMGVDLGKHEDFTVLTVVDRQHKKVVFWDRFKEIDYPLQKARIIATANKYNNARIVVDSTGVGQPICDDLRHLGMFVEDFHFSGKSKPELVEKLSIFLEQKHIIIPNNQILIDELEAFGYQLTESGNVTYEAPRGLHDDAVMSLALAIWTLTPGEARPITPMMREQRLIKRFLNIKKQSFI